MIVFGFIDMTYKTTKGLMDGTRTMPHTILQQHWHEAISLIICISCTS
jgi:hypothetical protein